MFDSCRIVDRLDNGVDVDNEEQGEPVAVCTDPQLCLAGLWDGSTTSTEDVSHPAAGTLRLQAAVRASVAP